MHTITSGDTLFGIALEYGVTVDALILLNGLSENDYLHIGQVLIIPLDQTETSIESVSPVLADSMILPTPTPLPLDLGGIALYRTAVGGLLCMGEVLNVAGLPATNLQVQVFLLDAGGAPLASQVALAAADYLAPETRAPFALLFPNPPLAAHDVSVRLLRAEMLGPITAGFTPLMLQDVAGAISGPQYRVSGRLLNASGQDVNRVTIVATIYDAAGRVSGYRESVLDEARVLGSGATLDFHILLTPQGGNAPDSFQAIAWGSRVN